MLKTIRISLASGSMLAVVTALFISPVVMADEKQLSDVETEIALSDIDMTEVDIPSDYTELAPVSEIEGDQQQENIVSGEPINLSLMKPALAARIDLTFEVAVLGINWDQAVTSPESVSYRTLEDGVWGEWQEIEIESIPEDIENPAQARSGTEGIFLTNTDSVEVVLAAGANLDASAYTLNVIDPDTGKTVENNLADLDKEQYSTKNDIQSEDASLQPVSPELGETGGPESKTENYTENEYTNYSENVEENEDQLLDQSIDSYGVYDAEIASVNTAKIANNNTRANSIDTDTGIGGLVINSRAAWGADETIMDWKPESITIQGAVVHHTAGSNNYSQSQVPSVIRGIYTLHSQTLGWGDIGYHMIVDKYGGVWEGRSGGLTKGIEGGHARGANQNTFGISVLGDFTNSAPSTAAQESVAKAVAWKLGIHGIYSANGSIRVAHESGNGAMVKTVSGHRDVSYTACPGNSFYPLLSALRNRIDYYINTGGITPPTGDVTTNRLYGDTRVDTAVAISNEQFGASVKGQSVYLVNSSAAVDAMAAGVVTDGPILMVNRDSIPTATFNEIKRLQPAKIYAIGGTGVVSDAVLNQAKKYALTGVTTKRLGGVDRIATALEINKHVFPNGSAAAYVADYWGPDGNGSPDAISGANVSNGPVLLTPKTVLDPRTGSAIQKIKSVYELGSANLHTGSKNRLGGVDRYETSTNIARHAYSANKLRVVYMTRGDLMIDGVTAGTLTAGPRILVNRNGISDSTCKFLKDKAPSAVVAIGGTAAIPDFILQKARMCAESGY